MAKTIAGALVGKALGAYGKKPVIPELPVIDPSQIQTQTLAGNQSILPQATALAQAINANTASQYKAIQDQLAPGAFDQTVKNINAELRGELPQDVISANDRYTNALAMQLGIGGGSPFRLGLTGGSLLNLQLQQQQRGMQNYAQLSSAFPRQYDFTQAFFTPQQRLSFAFQDRTARMARDLLAEQVKAAPNPADVALAEGFDNFFEFWKNIGGAALGNVMGGMGGGGGGVPKMNSSGMGIG